MQVCFKVHKNDTLHLHLNEVGIKQISAVITTIVLQSVQGKERANLQDLHGEYQ